MSIVVIVFETKLIYSGSQNYIEKFKLNVMLLSYN